VEPVAITGLSCRFPGAPSPARYWELLEQGRGAVGAMPEDRLAVWQALGQAREAAPRGGYLDTIDAFEPEFFALSPREAARMDPQQRLLLELAWEALEDAGEIPARLAETNAGVFVGIMNADHALVHGHALSMMDAHLGIGSSLGIAANRISYALDLRGPSLAIDTLCSSSLVAVHLACQALAGDPSMPLALAGGVNIMSFPAMHLFYGEAGLLSPDGVCRAFDAGANGIVRGEGGGLVVLKRLADARRDGDLVYCVIRGSAVNQDGRSNGLTAPNRFAQERVLLEAYRRAEVSPGDVQFVEAHGTGTLIGDPIELRALGSVLARGRAPGQRCAISSVKTNFGHLESAAGIAALIKTTLSLQHRRLLPSLNFASPNPYVRWAELPLRVVTAAESWPDDTGRAFAGVSSFGLGGTNAHLVLEGVDEPTAASRRDHARPHLLPLSARTRESLRLTAAQYRDCLRRNVADLESLVHSAARHRTHHAVRLAVVGDDAARLAAGLESFLADAPGPGVVPGPAAHGHGDVPPFGAAGPLEVAAQRFVLGGELEPADPSQARLPRVRLPTYPFHRRPLSTGVVSMLNDAPSAAAPNLLYDVVWESVALVAGAAPGATLVVGAPTALGSAIGEHLARLGAPCLVLDTAAAEELLGADLENWHALIRHAKLRLGAPPVAIVHCFGLATLAPEADPLAAAGRPGCRSLLALVQALAAAGASLPTRLWVATRGARATTRDEDPALAHAAVVGLAKVIRLEHPELWGALVDFDPQGTPDADARALLATMTGGGGEPEVAWRRGTQRVPRLVPGMSEEGREFAVRSDASYLITGGFGGLGRATAAWLVGRGARHLALLGRRGRPPDADAWVAGLEALGVEVRAWAVDVADQAALESVWRDVSASMPPLAGVFHAAGLVDDKLLYRQAWGDFEAVFGAKVHGAFNLHRLTRDRPVDVLVLFSSIASVIGSPGQGNYAAANAVLDSLGQHRNVRGLPAVVINWGPWADVGMAAQDEARGASRGLVPLRPEQALRALGQVLGGRRTAMTVAAIDWARLFASSPAAARLPLLARLRSAPGPAVCAVPAAASQAGENLVAFLKRELGTILNLAPDAMSAEQTLDQLGLDSLLGLELQERIEKGLGQSVSVASFFGITLPQLAAHLGAAPAATPSAARPPGAEVQASGAQCAPDVPSVPGSPWLVPIRVVPGARLRLFCFPYAGGAAHGYRSWREGVGDDVEVWAIELPGRGARRSDSLMTRVPEIVDALVPALSPLLDRPFAFFGHCLGAIVMYETARCLSRRRGLVPRELFVSGAPAPQLYLIPQVYGRSDERFREVLELIRFANSEPLFRDAELLRRALPAVRADFEAAAAYRFTPTSEDDGVLDAPITAFGAWDDVFAPHSSIEPWRERSRAEFSLFMRPGEHYFIETERSFLHEVIAGRLAGEARAREAATSQWISVPVPRPAAPLRLFCFPHLGGDAGSFEAWASRLPPEFEVVCLQLPYGAAPADEASAAGIEALADRIAAALTPWLDRPFAFFGHDVGALLLLETTHRLLAAGGPLPRHLFVSAAMAPHLNFFPPVHLFGETRLRDLVRFFGMDLEGHPARWRRDFRLIAGYRGAAPRALAIPITAFAAWEDTLVPYAGVEAWREHCESGFELLRCEGGHDAWRGEEQRAAMLQVVCARLQDATAP
jgi:surfactin synthase thioesterase subunit/3-oxoacyl-(acyl-carrier-protein) synthase/NAD(P)-dependent dehydrogenase (short-subunit alcohol dehydrogenase family)